MRVPGAGLSVIKPNPNVWFGSISQSNPEVALPSVMLYSGLVEGEGYEGVQPEQ